MPLTITKLKMWKDPGYTRQCLNVPPAGSKKLPAADWMNSENLRPRKNTTLTAVELPISYLEVFDMSYLYMEVEDAASPPHTVSIFGWITAIEEIASSSEAVRITWTPDYWRTYSDRAVFGSGTVTRCTDGNHKRPYPTQPRKWKVTHYDPVCQSWTDWASYPFWVVITYLTKVNQQVTDIATYFWQTGFTVAKSITYQGNTYNGVGLTKIFSGQLPGLLGLNPDQIASIFITPHPPDSTGSATIETHGTYYMYRAYVNLATQQSTHYNHTYETNDMKKAVIIDPTGAVIYTLPWGNEIDEIYYLLDNGTVGCNLDISLRKHGSYPLGVENAPVGLTASLPCINAPLNSNGWSSYNYSGQRTYDIEMKKIQREETAIKGVIGAGSSMLGGGIGGAMVGKGVGAGVGAGLGAATSIFTSGLNMLVSEKYDDQYQKATDELYANQASTVLQSAGGVAFINTVANAGNWYIVQLEADDVSAAEYTADVGLNGYETNIAASDVTSYITTGGALQIVNLNLTGEIPPEAKTYIKNKLENGVRIIENNPSGVVP